MAIDDILEPPSSNTGLIVEVPAPFVAPSSISVTWSRADSHPYLLLTNNDLTVTSYGGYNGGRATAYLAENKKAYWEYTISGPDSMLIGFASLLTNLAGTGTYATDCFVTNYVGTGYYNGNGQFTIGNAVWPAIVGYAVDTTLNLLWVRINNGAWYPSGDPAAGTGGLSITSVMRSAYALPDGSGVATANFGDSAFSYPAPSGFSSYVVASISNLTSPTTVTLNPYDKSPYIVLSNGNLTATTYESSGAYWAIRANKRLTAGSKSYFEMTSDSTRGLQLGLASRNELVENTVTAFIGGVGLVGYAGYAYAGGGGSFSVTGIPGGVFNVGFAIDRVNYKAWLRIDGGPWFPSGGDPTTNSGGFSIDPLSDIAAIYMTGSAGVTTSTANFGNTAFAYAAPSGFSAYKDNAYSDTSGFDPNYKGPGITLSNSNHTATQTSTPTGYSSVNADYSLPHTAKAYFEYTFNNATPYLYMGLTNYEQSLTNTASAFLDGVGLKWTGDIQQSNSTVDTVSISAGTHTLCIAVDMWAEKAWVRLDGGSWFPSGSNPVGNIGGYTIGYAGNIAGVSLSDGTAQSFSAGAGQGTAIINLGDSPFTQALPAAFKSYLYYRDGTASVVVTPSYPIQDILEKSVTRTDVLMYDIPKRVTPDLSYSLTSTTI